MAGEFLAGFNQMTTKLNELFTYSTFIQIRKENNKSWEILRSFELVAYYQKRKRQEKKRANSFSKLFEHVKV